MVTIMGIIGWVSVVLVVLYVAYQLLEEMHGSRNPPYAIALTYTLCQMATFKRKARFIQEHYNWVVNDAPRAKDFLSKYAGLTNIDIEYLELNVDSHFFKELRKHMCVITIGHSTFNEALDRAIHHFNDDERIALSIQEFMDHFISLYEFHYVESIKEAIG